MASALGLITSSYTKWHNQSFQLNYQRNRKWPQRLHIWISTYVRRTCIDRISDWPNGFRSTWMYLFKHTKHTPFVKPRGFGQSKIRSIRCLPLCNFYRNRIQKFILKQERKIEIYSQMVLKFGTSCFKIQHKIFFLYIEEGLSSSFRWSHGETKTIILDLP